MSVFAPKIAPAELQEPPSAIDQKAQILVDHIRKSKHFIAFTGAGISTSAGIPDFRGPEGNWTLRAQGRQRTEKVNTLTAIPTPTHMALVELQNRGMLKYLVSQNCDGLHRRSGILPGRISELHGNSNREFCQSCGKEYLRDFRAVATYEKSDHDHRTGRRCALPNCAGPLLDSIVNFGEDLPAKHLSSARAHAKQADLCLTLGSSLTVTPANEIPAVVGKRKGGKLVICNLQPTPLDDLTSVRIYSKTDELMTGVMAKLEIPIPPFVLRRRLVVEMESAGGAKPRHAMTISGVDVDGTPATFLQSVKLKDSRRVVRAEPFVISFREELEEGRELRLELEFMGHYGECNAEVVHVFSGDRGSRSEHLLEYEVGGQGWVVSQV
ncbi:NAD-dependent deacetylase sirtuin-7 [Mytilinidion resinicola]|uniref:protein acetyllysine N-acetyltransferase n=1 Tax=Mytilinidion resinicola TaxID=574789 RepID=A0A6A6Y2N2_9PEZI|nr:NAD-dependent deacetylase sirtuin-7 [Mytilinidion resinicola]KAF2803071.1 NAD-dependent deacetylase sirtuin-7 [Mytilinidion resinicola]